MATSIRIGGCVELPDGRIGRVRARLAKGYKIRVRRQTSRTHQFVVIPARNLRPIQCPEGRMSPDGYNRYLRATLHKLRKRQQGAGRKRTS